jgi:hypothetical protein
MHKNIRNLLLALGIALLVLPAAISDGHMREHKAGGHEKHGAKPAQYVFKGTFHLADSSVTVAKGNRHVRRAGLVGKTVVFDLSAARIRVADTNGDGTRDAADLQDGDQVVIQARLPRRDPGAGPFAARKLVDQTHKKAASGDDESGSGHHESGDDAPEGADD